jgi:hypothetical protein
VSFLESQNIICNLVGLNADPFGIDSNFQSYQKSTEEMGQSALNDRLLAGVHWPFFDANIASNAKHNWVRIISEPAFQVNCKRAAIIYNYCHVFQNIY